MSKKEAQGKKNGKFLIFVPSSFFKQALTFNFVMITYLDFIPPLLAFIA